MAKPRSNDPIEPMDLANMRQNGVRSLAVQCHQCRHEAIMNVDHLPGDVTVPSLARLHQLRGLGDAKVLKSLGHSPKGRHYRG
jgi:hypothetical protein